MSPDVFLQSIEFEVDCSGCTGLGSVRVNLSNGMSSPVFKNEGHTRYNHETFSFD